MVHITHYTSPSCTDRLQMNIHCIQSFFTVHDFCACPNKTELPWNFSLYWIYSTFYTQIFWATCTCPEKTEMPWNFSLYWIYFSHSEVLSNLRLPWKTELPWNFSLYWNIFYHFRIFEQLTLALKFFTVLNIFFTFRSFEQLALALKNRVALDFSLYWNIFYHSGFLSN